MSAPVEALTLHDEGLRPEHLLGRDQAHGEPEDLIRDRVREPRFIDRGQTIAEPKMTSMKFSPQNALPSQCGKVSSVANPASASAASALSTSCRRTKTSNLFRVALDAGVAGKGVSAAEQKWRLARAQHLDGLPIERGRRGWQWTVYRRRQRDDRTFRNVWQCVHPRWLRERGIAIQPVPAVTADRPARCRERCRSSRARRRDAVPAAQHCGRARRRR